MIKKICDLIKIEDNYILQPRSNDRLENLCIIPNSNHNSECFDTDDIFDLRQNILNKGINEEIHFYLMLFDENMTEISLDDTNCKEGLIYTFNREKVKKRMKTILNYNPHINKFNIETTTNIYDKNIIYIGNSKKVTMKQIAFESSGCMNSFYSDNGGGYYGFQLKLHGLDKEPKQAILFGYNSKQNVMNRSHLKNNIQRVINYEQITDDIPLVYATPIRNEIQPSAPPQEIMPSAPQEIMPSAPQEIMPSAPQEIMPSAPPEEQVLFDKI